MADRDKVLLFPCFDHTPEVQADIPDLWRPYGLEVESRSLLATEDNYGKFLEQSGEDITSYATEGNVFLVGLSNGGKIALSLLLRHPDSIQRIAISNTKIGPYDFKNPYTRQKFPNLTSTSDFLQQDLNQANPDVIGRVLCMRSMDEDVLDNTDDAILEGAHNVTTPTRTHSDGIEYVARNCGLVIAEFFQDGTVPDSV